ncbi:MAG: inorganic phosphate transporter [Bacteroidales bacterium]
MFGLDLSLTLLLIFCIFAALSFEFINGFHDTANAVATVIYTHSLKPRVAVIWSGIWNFIGVNVGGIAVAIGIINLLPLEALTDASIYHSISMILALIFTAILWNLGTWYLGIPCSSSHTLLGSIFGVGIAYMLLPGSHEIALNWGKVKDVGLSLLISPLIGFFMAMFLMFFLKRIVKNKVIFKEPPAKKAPPMWIRSVLVLTCTFVSFSHGSNDGQKGVGLLMIILIAIVPVKFAIDHTRDPQTLHQSITSMHGMLASVNHDELSTTDSIEFTTINTLLDSLDKSLAGLTTFAEISKKSSLDARRDILLVSKKSETLLKRLNENPIASVNDSWIRNYRSELKEIRSFTEYAPMWVILAIALSLGLGTMVGWKRIVVTIGEKIGKSHLTYAQGASAELIAATTISVSSWFGLPVSTTHVLSSGVAGTMVAENGTKNLQKKTVAAIGIAWLVTLPVTILFSGVLFLVFRMILG